jgi:hypothetical protein
LHWAADQHQICALPLTLFASERRSVLTLAVLDQDLVLNQKTDHVCLDDIIVDLKLTPDALEMKVPRYFRDDRDAEIKKREELMVSWPSMP